MEGKTIEKTLELGEGITLLKMDDGTYASVKVIDPEIPAEDVEEFFEGAKPDKKEEKKKEEKKPEKEPDDELTFESLQTMKRKALVKLIEDRSLLTDADDFEDDDKGLRKAIADELELEPEEDNEGGKSEDKGKGEPESDSYTWKDLEEMDFEELTDLCKENKLDTDPADYEEGEEDKLRRAIATECDIVAPPKKKKL